MARIRVVTDSASDLPGAIAQRLDIDVVPLTIRFGDEEFTDLSPEDFWAKCKVAKTLPETSAPSPGAFQGAFERAKADGCDGVIVLTSRRFSPRPTRPPSSGPRPWPVKLRSASSTP